jgi:hypothetical protein
VDVPITSENAPPRGSSFTQHLGPDIRTSSFLGWWWTDASSSPLRSGGIYKTSRPKPPGARFAPAGAHRGRLDAPGCVDPEKRLSSSGGGSDNQGEPLGDGGIYKIREVPDGTPTYR